MQDWTNAFWNGSHSWRGNRRTGIGPSDPWKSSLMSMSVSILRKYGRTLMNDHSSLPSAAQPS